MLLIQTALRPSAQFALMRVWTFRACRAMCKTRRMMWAEEWDPGSEDPERDLPAHIRMNTGAACAPSDQPSRI